MVRGAPHSHLLHSHDPDEFPPWRKSTHRLGPAQGKTGEESIGSIPTLIALTVNFGVPPLLFVQVLYGHLFYSSSVMLAVPWILVIPILILAYYAAYIFVKRVETAPLLVKGSPGGYLPIPALYCIYFCEQQHPGHSARSLGNLFSESGWLEPEPGRANTLAQVPALCAGGAGHWRIGSGHMLYIFPKWMQRKSRPEIKRNLKIFGWITLIQLGIGTWFWLSCRRMYGKPLWEDPCLPPS